MGTHGTVQLRLDGAQINTNDLGFRVVVGVLHGPDTGPGAQVKYTLGTGLLGTAAKCAIECQAVGVCYESG
jgi:hypothetical protein